MLKIQDYKAGGTGGLYGPTSYTYNTNTGNLASAGSVTFAYNDALPVLRLLFHY